MTELRSCPNPWCHSCDELPPTLRWFGYEAAVECASCGMQGPSVSPRVMNEDGDQIGTRDAEGLATEAWNTRRDTEERGQIVAWLRDLKGAWRMAMPRTLADAIERDAHLKSDECPTCAGRGRIETGEMETGPGGVGFEAFNCPDCEAGS